MMSSLRSAFTAACVGALISTLALVFLTIPTRESEQAVSRRVEEDVNDAKSNEEWEPLGSEVFFRRSAAFYFADARQAFVLYAVCVRNATRRLRATRLTVSVRRAQRTLLDVELRGDENFHMLYDDDFMSAYQIVTLNVTGLDLLAALHSSVDFDHDDPLVQVSVVVHAASLAAREDDEQLLSTTRPILVQVKRPAATKRGVVCCTSLLYYDDGAKGSRRNQDQDDERYEQLAWWLEANRLIGYAKLVVADHSIPRTARFRSLLRRYEPLVELLAVKTFPILSADMRHFSHFSADIGELDAAYHWALSDRHTRHLHFMYNVDLFRILFNNECLQRHAHTHTHVAVLDMDELLVPHVARGIEYEYDARDILMQQQQQQAELNMSCNAWAMMRARPIEAHLGMFRSVRLFLDETKQTTRHNSSYCLESAKYLSSATAERLIDELAKHLKTDKQTSSLLRIANLSIAFRTADDWRYARRLVDAYREVMRSAVRQERFNLFDRFVYVNKRLRGEGAKCVYDTDATRAIYIHGAYEELVATTYLNGEYARVAHFRSVSNLPDDGSLIVDIGELRVDLNYWTCFYSRVQHTLLSSNSNNTFE